MIECPDCGKDMILFQNDTPNDTGWGGYRLYGCRWCGRVVYKHIDMTDRVKKMLTKGKKGRPKKRIVLPKPYHDPFHHHDSHLIN